MYCKKCNGKVRVEPSYSSEAYMNLACMICGKNWDLELNGGGNGQILGRWLQKVTAASSNGN